MELKELSRRAQEIKQRYRQVNNDQWSVAEYAQGFVGDVGQLMKLVMAKNGFRQIENVDQKLEHELADCLWSILVIAEELGIDLEAGFIKTMDELQKKLSS